MQIKINKQVSKEYIAGNVAALVAMLEEGQVDPLTFAVQTKAIAEVAKQVSEAARGHILAALESYPKNTTTVLGAKIEQCEVATQYDYSASPKWVALNAEFEAKKAELTALEQELKKARPGVALVDEDGELIGYGPAKKSTTSYKITLQK